MWSDNDIDQAFQRLNPPEPDPASFPLDAWLRLETQLDEAVIARAVRRKLWRYFAAEVVLVALVALGWLLWPAGAGTKPAAPLARGAAATNGAVAMSGPAARHAARFGPGAGNAAGSTAAEVAASPAPATPVAPSNASPTAEPAVATTATGAVAPAASAAAPTTTTAPTAPTAKSSGRALLLAAEAPEPPKAKTAAVRPREAAGRAATAAISPLGQQGRSGATKPFGRFVAPLTSERVTSKRTASKRMLSDRSEASRTGIGADISGAATKKPWLHSDRPDAAVAAAGAPGRVKQARGLAAAAAPTAVDGLSSRPAALLPAAGAALPATLAIVALALPAPAPAQPAADRRPRLYVGLVGAPDVSTVRFATVHQPLPNVGVVLEYRLTPRLRLSTGLLRATKQYDARRSDYDWTKYPKAYYRDFALVNAACTVLDVPLNLRYDLLVRPRGAVFGSAGLSSFFMQREVYSYGYVENSLPAVWERGVVNENHHLFSILNLSVGYERRLGRHWSAQAEPYLKLPLAGVGAGRVRLTSAGVFFGLKYGF